MKLKRESYMLEAYFLAFILMLSLIIASQANAQPKTNELKKLQTANSDTVTSLDLHNFGLTSFPKEIYSFKNLKSLDLSNNDIGELPLDIDQLNQLQFVDLSGNNIKELPVTFSNLVNLRSIYLGSNQSLNVDQVFEVIPANAIQILDLEGDNITSLPKTIGQLKNLRKLNLSGNSIRLLPNTLSQLPKLKVLYINDDPYFDVDKNLPLLGEIKSLEELHLEGDEITSIPDGLLGLENLEYLYLNQNSIERLPDFNSSEITSLKYLDISNNPIPKHEVHGLEDRLAPTIKVNFINKLNVLDRKN